MHRQAFPSGRDPGATGGAGTPDIHAWANSWYVLRTSFLTVGLLHQGILDSYHEQLTGYHTEYGDDVWLLLYQTDVRFRLEHMERIGLDLDIQAARNGVELQYKTKWRTAFVNGLRDSDWRRE